MQITVDKEKTVISPEMDTIDSTPFNFFVENDSRTGRAEIMNIDGKFIEPCTAWLSLLKHVSTCQECDELILMNAGDEDDETLCDWMTNCGFRVQRSRVTYKRILTLLDMEEYYDGED